MIHYTKTTKQTQVDDATGAEYWSAKLNNLMFTWFTVPAKTNFQEHSHDSEQMTYVLEGALFFEVNHEIVCLRAGDFIAVPSNVIHRVWTEEERAVAIDAWSPVNDLY